MKLTPAVATVFAALTLSVPVARADPYADLICNSLREQLNGNVGHDDCVVLGGWCFTRLTISGRQIS